MILSVPHLNLPQALSSPGHSAFHLPWMSPCRPPQSPPRNPIFHVRRCRTGASLEPGKAGSGSHSFRQEGLLLQPGGATCNSGASATERLWPCPLQQPRFPSPGPSFPGVHFCLQPGWGSQLRRGRWRVWSTPGHPGAPTI